MNWDVAVEVGEDATIAAPGCLVALDRLGDDVWRMATHDAFRDVWLPRGAARVSLRPALPAEPLALCFAVPLQAVGGAGALEGWGAMPVEAVLEVRTDAGVVDVLTITPPRLRRKLAVGPVDAAELARAVDVAFRPGPLPEVGPPGECVVPLRFERPGSAATIDRLVVPAGVLSLYSRGPRLVSARLNVGVPRENDVHVAVQSGPPAPDMVRRFGPPDGPRSFSARLGQLARRGLGLEYGA
ncbi:MAG: hypothetical protein H6704_11980 [Myxococcales bacterium]|nr:hypothetical protein [Myxococcales bacterium]